MALMLINGVRVLFVPILERFYQSLQTSECGWFLTLFLHRGNIHTWHTNIERNYRRDLFFWNIAL